MRTLDTLLGEHSEIAAIRAQLERLFHLQAEPARRLPPILIEGETGTGKGLLAAAIHNSGPRASASFVDVNCAAIPETLLESELFGYERGAFTGAQQAKAGLLQTAHRGTIFLDEIGLMPEPLQAKLLKVIEERSVRRLGSTRSEAIDVSIIAAANIDLKAAIQSRRFREDLYHRLAVVTLRLPPLRARGNDVFLLAEHFLRQACSDYGVPAKRLTADAVQALKAHSWPGNVRELANAMERMALLSDSDVVTANTFHTLHLKSTKWQPHALPQTESLDDRVAALERSQLEEALEETKWNISHAAARLGVARNTFRYRMAKYGLTPRRGLAQRRSRSAAPAQEEGGTPPKPAEAASPSVRWERRRITFLQVAIVGRNEETALVDYSRMMEEFVGKTMTFGGKIGELSATRLLCFFGLEPSEDAPRRAAHMAMTVLNVARRAGLGGAQAVIVAIHTSQCLVGRLGDATEIDSTGKREVQAVLDRLASIGAPNSIVVSQATASFLGGRFDLESFQQAEGGERVFRLSGLREGDPAAAPFVGRRRELALLDEGFKLVEDNQGQMVVLLGEAGIGKSRLLREFRHSLGQRAMWTEGRAASFGQSMPFYPLIDMLRHAFGIEDGDANLEIAAKIETGLPVSVERFRAALPFLQYLLQALPADSTVWTMDPKLRRAQIFDALRQFLVGVAGERPHVIVVEDVHWMDQATGEFLAMLADGIAAHKILLILTSRPGFSVRLEERTFHTRVALTALSVSESGQIAAALLQSADLPDELRALIDRKAEGNPFYVEEITRSLLESKVILKREDGIALSRQLKAIDIPDTIEDVILTRLERLGDDARRLLQSGAVIGREFPRRLLDRLESSVRTPEILRELKATEFIYEKLLPEPAYAFKHALIHEVTYNSMDEARRRELHRRTGDVIEEIYADRLTEQYGVLAYHFSRAANWRKALEYLIKAAQQAALSFATLEALNLYDEALSAARYLGDGIGDPSTLIGIHQAKATLYFMTSQFDRSRAEAEQVLPLARLTSNSLKEAEALAAIAWAATWSRDLDGAIDSAGKALQVAEPAGALSVQARAHFAIGFVRAVSGETVEGHLSLHKAIRLSEQAGDAVHHSLALGAVGLIENWRGDYEQAAKLQTEALMVAREKHLLFPLLFSCFLRGMTLTGKGDYDDAFSMFQEGMTLAEQIGDEAIHHRLMNCLGWLYAEIGELDRAQILNEESAEIGRRRNDPGTRPNAEVNLGEICMARGDLAAAEEIFEDVHQYWLDPAGSRWMRFRYSIRLFCNMGELALARGDLAKAKAMNALCLEGASRTDSKKNLVKAYRLEGEIARARKEWKEAEYYLGQALDIARAIGNPPQLWKTHAAFGRLLEESGQPELASRAFNAARQVIDRVGTALQNQELRAIFQAAGFVQKLRGLA